MSLLTDAGLLKAAALFDLAIALFHLGFWRLFGWPATLKASGHLNAAVTQTMNAVLIYVALAYGAALWWAEPDRPASMWLALAGGGLWLWRAGLQPWYFASRSRRSRAFTVGFAAGAALHLGAAWAVAASAAAT